MARKKTTQTRQYVVGVDLGGTKILAGVFDADLNLIGKAKKSTKAKRGVDAVMDRIVRCVFDAIDECDLKPEQIRGVGIGAPGATDPESGRVIFAPNLEWRDVPLKAALEKPLGLPVFAENDCNIQALGVHEKELGGEARHLVGIFLGTGIGAGLIFNGELYSGFNRTAGEIGHMVLESKGPRCGCGNAGCFEALASRSGMTRRLRREIKAGRKTVLTEMLGAGLKNIKAGDFRKALKKGDKLVANVVKDAAVYTGIAVGNVINLLNPDVVVLGGGVMEALAPQMVPTIEQKARQYAMGGVDDGIQIVVSKLGDDAGITGAAVLARRRTA